MPPGLLEGLQSIGVYSLHDLSCYFNEKDLDIYAERFSWSLDVKKTLVYLLRTGEAIDSQSKIDQPSSSYPELSIIYIHH